MNISKLQEACTNLNIIQNGRYATILFIIGSYILLAQYDFA